MPSQMHDVSAAALLSEEQTQHGSIDQTSTWHHMRASKERGEAEPVFTHTVCTARIPSITYSNQHASKLRLLTRKTTRRSRHGGWDSWNVNNKSPRRPAAWFLPDFVPPHPALHLPSWDWPLSHLSGRIIANYRAPQEQSSRSRSHAFPGRQSQHHRAPYEAELRFRTVRDIEYS
jgi:hypothetical protein